MTAAVKSIALGATVLVLLAGGAALAYARWTGPVAEADRAIADGQLERALAAYARAEAELRRALDAAPDDWDTKYDFELVTRLASELRKQPKTPPNQLMQLLRPQPKAGAKPVRRVG